MDRETVGVRALFPPRAREESPKVFIRNTDAPGAVDLAGLCGWEPGEAMFLVSSQGILMTRPSLENQLGQVTSLSHIFFPCKISITGPMAGGRGGRGSRK